MRKKITSKSFAQKFELKWSLGDPLSKLCVTSPFSINFRCKIENQVSHYRLLGASSLLLLLVLVSWNLLVTLQDTMTKGAKKNRKENFFKSVKVLKRNCYLNSISMIFSSILNLPIKCPSVQRKVAFFCDTPSLQL